MPDGSYVMDSYKIADIIEEKHPEPSLPLNTPVQLRFRTIMINFMDKLAPIYVPGVAQRVLGEESLDFFLASRQEDVGMPLDDYGKQHGPGAFEKSEPFAREITALLKETPSGPYFMGDTVSYADFMWAGILLFFKCLGTEVYEEVLKRTGDAAAHTKFLDALSLWTERNN
ncbi:thioredoxin [Trichoderma arundinaceum]|uniref:Thioredoxin n=1 Tax=Trichoderma arundinaceum TaxID=490622 RepID=A0A395NNM6_TRIAR|nr:thioredoxin [Trichoderma arundinaceum]